MVREPFWQDSEFQFLNHSTNGRDITFEEIRSGALPPASGPVAFIVPSEQRDLLPILQTAYPDGVLREQVEQGWSPFSAYLTPPWLPQRRRAALWPRRRERLVWPAGRRRSLVALCPGPALRACAADERPPHPS